MNKVCTKCGEDKPISEYYRHKRLADGSYSYKSECKACSYAMKRQWTASNREQVREYERQWREKNYGSVQEYSKQQWEKKRGPLVERQCKNERCGKLFQPESARQKYCAAKCRRSQAARSHVVRNPEKQREYSKKRWAKRVAENPPKIRKPGPNAIERTCTKCGETKPAAEFQKRRNICKACWKIYEAAKHQQHKAYYREQTRKRKMRKQNAEGFHTNAEWEALKAKHNYACLRCGKQVPTISLTRDHVKPLILGGTDYIDNIQPLCHSCNSQKNDTEIDYR